MTHAIAKFRVQAAETLPDGNGLSLTVIVDGPDSWDALKAAALASEKAFMDRLRAVRDAALKGPREQAVQHAEERADALDKLIDEAERVHSDLSRRRDRAWDTVATWGDHERLSIEAQAAADRVTRLQSKRADLTAVLEAATRDRAADVRAAVGVEALAAEGDANREHTAATTALAAAIAGAAQRYVAASRIAGIAARGPVAAEPVLREVGIVPEAPAPVAPAAEPKSSGPVHRFHGPDGTVTLTPGDRIDEGKVVRGVPPTSGTVADEYAGPGQLRVECDTTVHGMPGNPTVKLTKGQFVNARDLPGVQPLIEAGVLRPITPND